MLLEAFKTITKCQNVRRPFSFNFLALILIFSSFQVLSQETTLTLETLGRNPATYLPNDDIVIVPQATTIWVEKVFVEDDAGILAGVRDQLNNWEEREEYVSNWDLQSTGLYDVPDNEAKKRYLGNKLLKYLDKRLAGEIKQAESGSTMHTVGQVHKALRPSSETQLSSNIKVKFKARALQGKGYVIVDNPYVDAQGMVSADGRVEVKVEKTLTSIGFSTLLQYNVDRDQWVAQMDQRLTDNVSARVTSEQDTTAMAFGQKSNQTFQVMFNHSF